MNALDVSAGRALAFSLLLVAALLVGAGCNDDDDPVVPPPPGGYTTPEALMAAFVAVYEEQDIDAFRLVVHPDFQLHLSQATVDEFALPGTTFAYDEEMLIAERMFSGLPHVRPDQSVVPGITRIEFAYFSAETAWVVAGPEDRFPGAYCAQFRVDIGAEQGNEGLVGIQGIIEFALRNDPVQVNGTLRDRWRMVGQVDYTDPGGAKRPTEDTSWGELKALYR
ncbi:MAG: hypothetical protein R6X35_06320 [Candidatus Krumholzibacteriia bacterium]